MIMRPIFCARFEEILNISSLSMGLGTVDRVDMKYGNSNVKNSSTGNKDADLSDGPLYEMKAYGTISEMDSGDNDIHVSFYYNRETDHR
ncbi:hypothetical protein C5167_041380 [Papaver somniferum]|nr:hypothetical protein C5167_041380 [Papaver somniferum]